MWPLRGQSHKFLFFIWTLTVTQNVNLTLVSIPNHLAPKNIERGSTKNNKIEPQTYIFIINYDSINVVCKYLHILR